MNSLDITIILVCLLSTLIGFVRGFVASTFGTCGWIAAILINHSLFPSIEPFLEAKFNSKLVTFIVGYAGVLVALLLIFSILNFIVASMMQKFTTGYIDKVGGALFGVARGALISIICFLCFDTVATILWGSKSTDMMPSFVVQASTLPLLKKGELVVLNYLPRNFKSNLSFYADYVRHDGISELSLINLVRKLGQRIPLSELNRIHGNYDEKYMSKRQVLTERIRDLLEYCQTHNINAHLSEEEQAIVQLIINN